ncbi:hypothetical protein INT47_011528 [Mucor saturninus]|uniref:Uncharacterized protein n=1 Tax=Mucor saturninus TaxID=64648 RepID=A0A8H7QGI8_9FUNG|nr:hypothetical protein INT47_011528 [Mucor saturninus]
MPFHNFVNGYNPTTPDVRGRPTVNVPAPAPAPSPEPSVSPSAVRSGSTNEPSVKTTSSPATGSIPATGSMPSASAPSSTGSSEPSSSAPSAEHNPVDEPSPQFNTNLNWDSASTHVLMELFPDYIVKIGVTRSPQAKTRRNAANATGSAPLPHWEFHDLMEQATSRMSTMDPPVSYSLHSRETVDSRGNFSAGGRGCAGVDDGNDDDQEEGRRPTQRPRYVNAATWFMAAHLEALEDQNREERARDRDITSDILRETIVLRCQNSAWQRDASLAINRMVDLFASSLFRSALSSASAHSPTPAALPTSAISPMSSPSPPLSPNNSPPFTDPSVNDN